MTALCFIALLVAVPTGIVGAVCMLNLARDLNRSQRNGYKFTEDAMPKSRPAPRWMRKEMHR